MATCIPGWRLSNGQSSSIVTFNDKHLHPMPNVDYLRIHAAFARVLHLCGAADHVEQMHRDAERMNMLLLDGKMDFGEVLALQLALGSWTGTVMHGKALTAY